MKKIVRKSMFVLSFLGLLTFVAPKQAKAEPPTEYPCTATICCPDGTCHYVACDNEEAYHEALSIICTDHSAGID